MTIANPALDDMPLGGLPPADPTLLAPAPLEVAIIEVRYTAPIAEITAEVASLLRDALVSATGHDFTSIQPAVQGTLQVNLGQQAAEWATTETRGWQIASADGTRSVSLLPGSFIIQVSEYERWSISIKTPLAVLLEIVSKHLSPSLVQRVGLRYVNRFVDTGSKFVADWVDRIDGHVLGPVQNRIFGAMISGAQQQVELSLDGRHAAILRHGPTLDPNTKSINYLIDLDVFNYASESFVSEEILTTANRLNRTALSLFQACVSTDYLTSLQGKGDHE